MDEIKDKKNEVQINNNNDDKDNIKNIEEEQLFLNKEIKEKENDKKVNESNLPSEQTEKVDEKKSENKNIETKEVTTNKRQKYTFYSDKKHLNASENLNNNFNTKKNYQFHISVVPNKTKKESDKKNQKDSKNINITSSMKRTNIKSDTHNKSDVPNTQRKNQPQQMIYQPKKYEISKTNFNVDNKEKNKRSTHHQLTQNKGQIKNQQNSLRYMRLHQTQEQKPQEIKIQTNNYITKNSGVRKPTEENKKNLNTDLNLRSLINKENKRVIIYNSRSNNKTQTKQRQEISKNITSNKNQNIISNIQSKYNNKASNRIKNEDKLNTIIITRNEQPEKYKNRPPTPESKSYISQKINTHIKIDLSKYNTASKPISFSSKFSSYNNYKTEIKKEQFIKKFINDNNNKNNKINNLKKNNIVSYDCKTMDNRKKGESNLKYYVTCPNCGYHLIDELEENKTFNNLTKVNNNYAGSSYRRRK